MKKLLALLLALVMCISVVTLVACEDEELPIPAPTPNAQAIALAKIVSDNWHGKEYIGYKNDAWGRLNTFYGNLQPIKATDGQLTYTNGTELRMATGYNSADTGITFSAAKAGSGVTLANGKTYQSGDLKPTWEELQKRLNVTFNSVYTGKSAQKEWENWEPKLGDVDLVSGTASQLNEAGAAGKVIDIGQYLDKMPNFAKYLNDNPIVRLSITGSVSNGAIYFSPYFDGVNDIERMPLMRADMVRKLLDGGTNYEGANRKVNTSAYTPYMPEMKLEIESLNATGTGKVTITKDYNKTKNIIAQMNAAENLTGNEAVAMFRKYIDDMYGSTYTNRSDLFLGYNACWDADELVALLRCAVASLNNSDGDAISGMFSRETENNQRQVDLFRFAGILFGARGMESRQDYLFFDKDGKLHDARQEADSYAAMEKMNAMYKEGLIIMDGTAHSDSYLEKDAGIVSYDYSQTQTLYNASKLQEGEEYTPAMVPVAIWNDGEKVSAMRFTESWRSVKTDGWALSKAGIGNDTNKLNAALKLIDYAYSKEGQILMSYGPDEFIKHENGKMVMFDFNGEQWPVISDATKAELWDKAGGNYTNYARFYLGSTLSFVKSQSFEFQCTHEVGIKGAAKISAAIKYGTIKHPELSASMANKWYMSVPTVLPHTTVENDAIKSYAELASGGRFGSSKNQTNLFLEMILEGYAVKTGN